MRHLNIIAFDEMVNAVIAAPATTSAELNSKLGMYDILSLHFVVDNITAGATFNAAIMHSGDGRNWISKLATANVAISLAAPPTPMFTSSVALVAGSAYQFQFLDSSSVSLPSLGFVAIWMWWSGAAQGHVKLHVSARDQGGR